MTDYIKNSHKVFLKKNLKNCNVFLSVTLTVVKIVIFKVSIVSQKTFA